MKLEDQRIPPQKNDHSLDPEFLTFRHHTPAIEIPPRIINSQRMDYKSLEKYSLLDSPISDWDERDKVDRQERAYEKELRSVRSQEKLGGFRQIYSKNQQVEGETDLWEQKEDKRNKKLKKMLARIRRNIEKQKRIEESLNEEIDSFERELEETNMELQNQEERLQELMQINEENEKDYERIRDHIYRINLRNKQLAERQEELERSAQSGQISLETSRQESFKSGTFATNLKEGIGSLKKKKEYFQLQVQKLQVKVDEMFENLKEVETIDEEILLIQTREEEQFL